MDRRPESDWRRFKLIESCRFDFEEHALVERVRDAKSADMDGDRRLSLSALCVLLCREEEARTALEAQPSGEGRSPPGARTSVTPGVARARPAVRPPAPLPVPTPVPTSVPLPVPMPVPTPVPTSSREQLEEARSAARERLESEQASGRAWGPTTLQVLFQAGRLLLAESVAAVQTAVSDLRVVETARSLLASGAAAVVAGPGALLVQAGRSLLAEATAAVQSAMSDLRVVQADRHPLAESLAAAAASPAVPGPDVVQADARPAAERLSVQLDDGLDGAETPGRDPRDSASMGKPDSDPVAPADARTKARARAAEDVDREQAGVQLTILEGAHVRLVVHGPLIVHGRVVDPRRDAS